MAAIDPERTSAKALFYRSVCKNGHRRRQSGLGDMPPGAGIDALSVEPSVKHAGTLATIAEAQAAAGDLQAALQAAFRSCAADSSLKRRATRGVRW
jgi:hypothetical protein